MHTVNIRGYGSMRGLAVEVGGLDRTVATHFFDLLGDEFVRQSKMDFARGRVQLGGLLKNLSSRLYVDAGRMCVISDLAVEKSLSEGSSFMVRGYGSFDNLVAEIGNLRYDALSLLFRELGGEFFRQGDACCDVDLSYKLYMFSSRMFIDMELSDRIWRLCEPYMN